MFRVIVIAMTILCPTLGHSNEKKEGTEQPAETRRDASSQNKMSPDRRSNISEIGFDIRPSVLFSEGETATGIIGDLSYTYYGKAFFVGFQLHPMRFTSFAGSPVGSFGTVVEGGYDSRFLMIGAGAGVRFYVAYVGPTTPGLVLSVPLRLGEKDGLNFKTTTAFAGETGASGMG